MHAVLAQGEGRAFAPEPITKDRRAELGESVLAEARALGKWLVEGDLARIEERVQRFVALPRDPIATRIHGDLHLGQILVTGEDFILIDFEGEPARSLAERRAKRSPLADVAGMVRSFDYAAATVLRKDRPADARAWSKATSDAFLAAYRKKAAVDEELFAACLDFYLVEKCLYEIKYEANNRPDWLPIPKDGLHDLLA
jgi:maltose alpha-D-glucosyltransferase/alpha-amylase